MVINYLLALILFLSQVLIALLLYGTYTDTHAPLWIKSIVYLGCMFYSGVICIQYLRLWAEEYAKELTSIEKLRKYVAEDPTIFAIRYSYLFNAPVPNFLGGKFPEYLPNVLKYEEWLKSKPLDHIMPSKIARLKFKVAKYLNPSDFTYWGRFYK